MKRHKFTTFLMCLVILSSCDSTTETQQSLTGEYLRVDIKENNNTCFIRFNEGFFTEINHLGESYDVDFDIKDNRIITKSKNGPNIYNFQVFSSSDQDLLISPELDWLLIPAPESLSDANDLENILLSRVWRAGFSGIQAHLIFYYPDILPLFINNQGDWKNESYSWSIQKASRWNQLNIKKVDSQDIFLPYQINEDSVAGTLLNTKFVRNMTLHNWNSKNKDSVVNVLNGTWEVKNTSSNIREFDFSIENELYQFTIIGNAFIDSGYFHINSANNLILLENEEGRNLRIMKIKEIDQGSLKIQNEITGEIFICEKSG